MYMYVCIYKDGWTDDRDIYTYMNRKNGTTIVMRRSVNTQSITWSRNWLQLGISRSRLKAGEGRERHITYAISLHGFILYMV